MEKKNAQLPLLIFSVSEFWDQQHVCIDTCRDIHSTVVSS